MRKKKAAIGLSVNFIVILILSIAVFSLSIVFLKNLFTGAETTKNTYLNQYENQMEMLACDNMDKVCVGTTRKQIDNKGFAAFTMQIVNTNDGSPFTISETDIEDSCKKASDLTPCAGSFGVSLIGTYTIPNNEAGSLMILIKREDAPKGTYIFDVDVISDVAPTDYGKEKLYVVVP